MLYGMNFNHRPEPHWGFGDPVVVAMMVLSLWGMFKRQK
jgi:Mg2+ and Co2+ transporter CorA